MEATIVNFRGGVHTQKGNHMIVQAANSKEEAEKLVGKKVTWETSSGKKINGEIKSAHGSKGAVRVIFETGMPGQSVGKKVSIHD